MKQLRGKDTVVDASLKEIKRHGTEGFPFAVYLNDFSSFQTDGICWHWHDELQITMITEGDFLCQVGSEKVRCTAKYLSACAYLNNRTDYGV